MDARFDQINEKINKNYEEPHVKIKQTNDDLTSKWTQFTSRIENSFLTLQEDQKKNQAVLTAILDRLQISNYLQPNSPRTPEQPDPLFNMSSSNAYTQGRQIRVKVELPKYDGDKRQCIAWINKAKEYLDIHNIHYDGEKIKYASIHQKIPRRWRKRLLCQDHKVTKTKKCQWVHLWIGRVVNSSPRVNQWPTTIDLYTWSRTTHPWWTRVTKHLYHGGSTM